MPVVQLSVDESFHDGDRNVVTRGGTSFPYFWKIARAEFRLCVDV